jgi:cardiolipin synthase
VDGWDYRRHQYQRQYINDQEKGKLYWDTFVTDPAFSFCNIFSYVMEPVLTRKSSRTIYFNACLSMDLLSVQIAASGPDSPASTIMLSFLKAINLAKSEILLTTPYFIPGNSILDALKVAALGGVKVKILVPGISDSRLVNAASWTNYGYLMKSGVEIYLYQKGFIHAKTMVIDGSISVVGTANMDLRSFDLNFEVNAIVYAVEFAELLSRSFYNDLQDAEDQVKWKLRPVYIAG